MKSAAGMGLALPAAAPGGPAGARLVGEVPGAPPPELLNQWQSVVTHTHNWRFGTEPPGDFEEAKQKLVEWCGKLGIRAIGIGSPWEPISRASYARYEGPERDLYYSERFDQKSVMDDKVVNGLVEELNRRSAGDTYFFLDNETPKGRYGHLWWFNYHYDYPAWHDYSQDRPVRYYESDRSVDMNSITRQPHTRRNMLEVLAAQRKAGAVGVLAHPTRWWTAGDRFVTNIAALAGLLVIVDGFLDGLVVMGDRVYHPDYQRLWFSLLDTGARVGGFAETDFLLNRVTGCSWNEKYGRRPATAARTFRNFMFLPRRRIDTGALALVARSGNLFMSNGAFLSIRVDGVAMGGVRETGPARRHKLEVEAYPLDAGRQFSVVEVIGRGGRVVASKRAFSGGVLEFELPGSAVADYVVVRAFGEGDDPVAAPDRVRYLALTNPVYLHPSGFRLKPATTSVAIRVGPETPWLGGWLEFQQADGRPIRRHRVRPGLLRAVVPASARFVVGKPGLGERIFYCAFENLAVQKHLEYLVYGEFRKDFPSLPRDQVPSEAFRLDALREAVSSFRFELK